MLNLIHTFRAAFHNARANLFHTLLSVLGMVIGVGALVSILSLIDGMEKYAHEQISRTTSLESVMVSTITTERVDNINVRKEGYSYFNYESFERLMDAVPEAECYIRYQESGFITSTDSVDRGVLLTGISDTKHDRVRQLAGRFIEKEDLESRGHNVVVSKGLADVLKIDTTRSSGFGEVHFKDQVFTVVGVIDGVSNNLEIFCPISVIPEQKLVASPPNVILVASTVQDVPTVEEKVRDFIEAAFPAGEKDFSIQTNGFRVEQANQGFLVFRIIMGLIVGISVLVGGIGVMNVLLISVTERTAEIGVRKAVGAKRKDIVVQFLAESLSISFIGSVLGLVFGILFTVAAVPVVKYFTKMPFEAAYTFETLLVIMCLSIVVGITFGTYPAMKASRLDPVEAIRRE